MSKHPEAVRVGERAVIPAGVASDRPLLITQVRLLDPLQQLDETVDLLIHDGGIVGWGQAYWVAMVYRKVARIWMAMGCVWLLDWLI